MKVKYRGFGILKNENGKLFLCDADGYGNVMDLETGELYVITRRDENDNPIEINEFQI